VLESASSSPPEEDVSVQQEMLSPSQSTAVSGAPAREHNLQAEQQMDVAEKLFYSGRYAEAIQLFDRVIQLEPAWERARQHRSEAENYLRTGYIPAVALPAGCCLCLWKSAVCCQSGALS
jgi:hypothetical protein